MTMSLLRLLTSSTAPIVAPAILGIPARELTTRTPRQTQRDLGLDVPSEAHADFRARQFARVFNQGERPSDEGLIESQEHLGPLDVAT